MGILFSGTTCSPVRLRNWWWRKYGPCRRRDGSGHPLGDCRSLIPPATSAPVWTMTRKLKKFKWLPGTDSIGAPGRQQSPKPLIADLVFTGLYTQNSAFIFCSVANARLLLISMFPALQTDGVYLNADYVSSCVSGICHIHHRTRL